MLLLFTDALPHHFGRFNQDLIRNELDGQFFIGPLHGYPLHGISDETYLQLHRELIYRQQKLTVEIRGHARGGAFDDDICGENRITQFPIDHASAKHLLGINRSKPTGHTGHQKQENPLFHGIQRN